MMVGRPCSLLALLAVLGCEESFDPPPIVWQGEHVQVGTELDLDHWCPGNLTYMDEYVGALEDLYGVSLDAPVSYYLLEPPISQHDVCPPEAEGCVDGETNAVATTWLPHEHELVHAVGRAHDGSPHFFEEGAATYFGFTNIRRQTNHSLVRVRERLDAHWEQGLQKTGYALAAHFAAYLVDTYGMEAYLSMLRESSDTQSRSSFEGTFAQTIGVTLDEAIDDYEANWPFCHLEGIYSSFFECAKPATRIENYGLVEYDFDMSCADPEVLGPMEDPDYGWVLWRDFVIEVDEPMAIDIQLELPAGIPEDLTFIIKPCGTHCGEIEEGTRVLDEHNFRDNIWHIADPPVPGWSVLVEPGRYVVRLMKNASDPGRVRFQLRT